MEIKKNLKLIFFIIFISTFLQFSKADDISDFQIEGMSIGDSLLNFYNEKKIKNSKMNYLKGKREFYVVGIREGWNSYENVEFYLKTGDNKYLIHGIKAGIFFSDNYDQCEKKKDKIVADVETIFSKIEMKDYGLFSHSYDKSGQSKQTAVAFNVEKGHIRVECVNWSKKITQKNNWIDNLSVSAFNYEATKWIEKGYP